MKACVKLNLKGTKKPCIFGMARNTRSRAWLLTVALSLPWSLPWLKTNYFAKKLVCFPTLAAQQHPVRFGNINIDEHA